MKRFNKLISIMMVVFIVLSIPFGAMAAVSGYEDCTAKILQAGDYDINFDRDYSKYSTTNPFGAVVYDVNMNDVEKKLEARIIQALEERWTKISFYLSEGLSRAWAYTMYSDVINDHPEFFYVSHNFGADYMGSTITAIYPKYLMSDSEISSAKARFNEGVDRALAQVDSSMNDMQKALTIHDYICSNATFTDDEKDSAHSAWGFFDNGHIVCAGYALTYSYLMNKAGVQCEMVTSINLAHGWNAVKIDGKYYNVDCSWDDASESIYGYPDGKVNHGNFLKSEAVFSTTHKREGNYSYDADTFDDCVRTDTTYDSNAWFDNIHTSIPVINGKYYYLKPDFKMFQVTLTERTQSGSESNITNFYTDYNSYTNTSMLYAYITKFENKLYVDAGTNYRKYFVYSVNPSTRAKYEVASIPSTPMGIGVTKQGNIFYQLKNNTNNYYELNRMQILKDNLSTANGGYNNYADVDNNGFVNARDYLLLKK